MASRRLTAALVLAALAGGAGCGGGDGGGTSEPPPHPLLSSKAVVSCLTATGAKVQGGRTHPDPGDHTTPTVALLAQRAGTGIYIAFYSTAAAAKAAQGARPAGTVVLKGRRLVVYVATTPEPATKKAVEGCVF